MSNKRHIRCSACIVVLKTKFVNSTLGEIQGKAAYQINAQIRFHARIVLKKLGRPKMCRACGYSIHVEVSHVRAISTFPSTTIIKAINDPLNLEYLWEYEHGLLTS